MTLTAATTAAFSLTSKQTVSIDKTAAAGQDSVEETLLTPTTYQQYLPLVAPSSVAVASGKKAIADGNAIYFYTDTADEYIKYEHTANADATKNVITTIQFADDGLLYFLDASTFLYSINPKDFSVEKTSLVCSAFTISGDEIFFVNVSANSQLSKTTLDVLDVSKADLLVGNLGSKPTVAMHNGILYYTNDGKYLHQIHEDTGNTPLIKYFSTEIYSMAFTDSTFAYTDIDGTLRVYALVDILGGESGVDALTPLFEEQGTYSSLTVHAGALYAVKGSSVKRFDTLENEFTDYEICSESNSFNRLSGATDNLLCGDLLFTADDGNGRVSIYDTKKNGYLPAIAYPFSGAKYLAADQKTLLVAGSGTAILFSLGEADYGTELASFTDFKGGIVGTACVYGKYYLVTDANQFYCIVESIDETAGKIWQASSVTKKTTQTARLLTSDVYGYLYVACGNDVYRFTEEEFISLSGTGEKVSGAEIPTKTTKLLVDYQQNVYALSENVLHKFGDQPTQFPLGKEIVYSQTVATPLTSVAFGVEENEAYLLYEGGIVLRTAQLNLATVKTIPTNGIDESIFAEESAQFAVVKTNPNALTVRFDINALQGATVFPYLSYARAVQPLTALKLGETNGYFLLAVLNETNAYDTFLSRTIDCEELPADDYRTEYSADEQTTGYLSNAVTLYKFPYLTPLLTVTKLEKAAQITLLGEIGQLDHDYYHVAYVDEQGKQKTGYVPRSYVNAFKGEPQGEIKTVVGEEKQQDSVFRLAFLVLGFGVICILTDFLLLRKKSD